MEQKDFNLSSNDLNDICNEMSKINYEYDKEISTPICLIFRKEDRWIQYTYLSEGIIIFDTNIFEELHDIFVLEELIAFANVAHILKLKT